MRRENLNAEDGIFGVRWNEKKRELVLGGPARMSELFRRLAPNQVEIREARSGNRMRTFFLGVSQQQVDNLLETIQNEGWDVEAVRKFRRLLS